MSEETSNLRCCWNSWKNIENIMVHQNAFKGMILCGPGYSQLYMLEKNANMMLCIPCWNELSSTHQGTADVKDHCASNVKEIQPLLQFETICWHPSRILHVKWTIFLLCRLRLWSLFCPHCLGLSLIYVRSTTSCTLSS